MADKRAPGPESLTVSLEGMDVSERVDELDPIEVDADVDLSWAREDRGHSGTIEAASHGDITLSEALDDVATSLGFRERSILDDDEDAYDH